ncbi:unnamed protein product [Gordionus sp. m RMFG-2023]
MHCSSILILICYLLFHQRLKSVTGIKKSFLLPYDSQSSTGLASLDETSSNEIGLGYPIYFYDKQYSSLFVNSNGILSFDTEIPSYVNKEFPIGYPLIAGLYSDIELSRSGRIYYGKYRNDKTREIIDHLIKTVNKNDTEFHVDHIFAATWENVRGYLQVANEGNTFQIILANGGNTTYAILLYPEDGINWYATKSKMPNLPPLNAQVGFDAGDGFRYYKLPNSKGHAILSLMKRSNVDIPGVWIYKIGYVRQINEPKHLKKLSSSDLTASNEIEICDEYSCPLNSICTNYKKGFCCKCKPGHFGNGINCIIEKTPLRVIGRVNGKINGEILKNIELHSYVVTVDGRIYTALSQVPPKISHSMKMLLPIAESINWLFAVNPENVSNGFTVTGGIFNRTTTINFPITREQIDIKEYFQGTDIFGNLKMSIEIQGDIPNVESHNQIDFLDYMEEFKNVAPGKIISQSKLIFKINAEEKAFNLNQEIYFDECQHLDRWKSSPGSLLAVTRNFAVYDEREQVVRFASKSKIRPIGHNPCIEILCPPYSSCSLAENSYKCRCNTGFRRNGELCHDVNECAEKTFKCENYTTCYNTPGSYLCRCNFGFAEDGKTCLASFVQYTIANTSRINQNVSEDCSKDEGICDINAECYVNKSVGINQCRCLEGYLGNGFNCDKIMISSPSSVSPTPIFTELQDCSQNSNICDKNAECFWDASKKLYSCRCKIGYLGDGRQCKFTDMSRDCSYVDYCHERAQCTYDSTRSLFECMCNPGYKGDGITVCVFDKSCKYDLTICGHQAGVCVLDPIKNNHVCQCYPGFINSGETCISMNEISCDENPAMCDPNAECVPFGALNKDFKCSCKYGFIGDGRACRAANPLTIGLIYAQGSSIVQIPVSFLQSYPDSYSNSKVARKRKSSKLLEQLLAIGHMQGKYLSNDQTQIAVGVGADCQTGFLYWTDVSGKKIKRSNHDGSKIIDFIYEDVQTPELLAIDWVNRNIFWTDSAKRTIEIASLDGKYRKVLVDKNIINPRGIALDWREGRIFWSDWNRDIPKIESCYMDGSDRKILIVQNIKLPNSLIFDDNSRQLCWVDAGTKNLECLNLYNNVRRVLVSNLTYPFGLTQTDSNFYWTDWKRSQIMSAEKQRGLINPPLIPALGGSGRIYGITNVLTACPKIDTNVCTLNKGGCQYICVPRMNNNRMCLCPDNVPSSTCSSTA